MIYSKELEGIDKEGIRTVATQGPGVISNYSIHQLEMIVYLMGAEAEKQGDDGRQGNFGVFFYIFCIARKVRYMVFEICLFCNRSLFSFVLTTHSYFYSFCTLNRKIFVRTQRYNLFVVCVCDTVQAVKYVYIHTSNPLKFVSQIYIKKTDCKSSRFSI